MKNVDKMKRGITVFLEGLNLDLEDQHLKKTPDRIVKVWENVFCSGYDVSVEKIFSASFMEECDEMVVVQDVPFCSMCSHHLLPFLGTAKIGYVPDGRVIGLSKLARVLDAYSRRLQIQERLTKQVAEAINTYLKPRGVGVVLKAEHMCMTVRGVQKPGSFTTTSCLLGNMRDNSKTRAEFLSL